MRTTPVPLGHVAVVHLYRRRPGRIWPGPSSGDPMRAPLVWPHPSPSPSLPTSTQHPRRSHEYLYLHPAPKTLYPLPFILPRRPTTLRPPLAATVSTGPLHILNPPRGLHPSARHSGPHSGQGPGESHPHSHFHFQMHYLLLLLPTDVLSRLPPFGPQFGPCLFACGGPLASRRPQAPGPRHRSRSVFVEGTYPTMTHACRNHPFVLHVRSKRTPVPQKTCRAHCPCALAPMTVVATHHGGTPCLRAGDPLEMFAGQSSGQKQSRSRNAPNQVSP